MKIECLCRGNQKVYILVSLPESAEGMLREGTLPMLCASANDGRGIPSMLYPFRSSTASIDNAFVAVLPDVQVQTVKLSFQLPSDGSAVGKVIGEYAYTPDHAKWKSRLAYKTQAALCAAIRDYDECAVDPILWVKGIDCIDDWGTKEDILRIAVTSLYAGDVLHVRVMDAGWFEYGKEPILMGRRQIPSLREEHEFYQESIYSIRMPKPEGVLYLMLTSDEHPEGNCFIAWQRERQDALRDETGRRMLDAGRDPYYQTWFELHKATDTVLAKQAKATFDYMPLFSIVVPLFKTPLGLFSEMLGSVLAQSYANWELLLVNASPEDEGLRGAVARAGEADARVKCVELDGNHGISENTNAGIERVSGDFVCFFDHDDLLEPNCLFEYARAVNEHPDADVLYCDEDKLKDGGLWCPYFKTDFNLDLLRNNNYICHLLTIRKALLDQLPPNTSEFDGAQDHNLVLEAVEKARYVHHVPRMLYHWRATPGSTADSAENKPYATAAGIKAVQAHIDRLGIPGVVVKEEKYAFSYKINYRIPEPAPLVSIVIPTKNNLEVLRRCLSSIFGKTTYDNYEVVLVDNGSDVEEVFAYYKELKAASSKRVSVVAYNEPFNFSAMINEGVVASNGTYLILLNNDTEVITPSWIEGMLGPCLREDIGAVGVRLYYSDETVQHGGGLYAGTAARHFYVNLPRDMNGCGYFTLDDRPQDVSVVTAACMMVSRADFDMVGGFSEDFPVGYNDVDFCFKLGDARRLILYEPSVELYHYESLSRGTNDSLPEWVRGHAEEARLNERWAEKFVRRDPYLNPNLAFEGVPCQYRSF